MNEELTTVYLDHNILDAIIKSRIAPVAAYLSDQTNCTPVYSSENLKEISNSNGYENEHLSLLRKINARYLYPNMDSAFRYTGRVSIEVIDPFDAYNRYRENQKNTPDATCGLSGLLQKCYGGHTDKSFEEIASNGSKEFSELIDTALSEISNSDEELEYSKSKIPKQSESIKDYYNQLTYDNAKFLDSNYGNEPVTKRFELVTGIGPKRLNNIKSPDVIKKIWELLKIKLPPGTEFEHFFGLKQRDCINNCDLVLTDLEKINAIYHQLNYIGFHRDNEMQKPRKFQASFSDLTHAGLAVFTKILFSCDSKFAKKASVAYEYLNVGPKVVLFRETT